MTTILVCNDPRLGTEDWQTAEGHVLPVNELCHRPRQLESLVPADEDQLVLAIHRADVNPGAVQAAVRHLGRDPLGVATIDLDAVAEGNEIDRAVRAAIARAASFPGAGPDQIKLVPPDRATRRSFLSLGSPTYVGAPKIDVAACVAPDGCRACAYACPQDALTWVGGAIEFDVNTCVACGICVTACPAGAVANPAAVPAAIEAEIRAALASGPAGIRYRCRAAISPPEASWHQVEIPCTGMLTAGWLIAPLLLGATGVDATPCHTGGCPLGNDEELAATVGDAVDILLSFGVFPGDALPANVGLVPEDGLFAPGATNRIIDILSPASPGAKLELAVADVGSVIVDPTTCTACRMCASACPTDALGSDVRPDGVHIDFDPGMCIACGQCVSICPEIEHGAIVMTRGFDLLDRASGRRMVRHDSTPLCEICGRPVAPASMLAKIEAMLGEDAERTMAVIGRRCGACRGR